MADFENLPSTNTPINATNLNKLLGYKGTLEDNTDLDNLTETGFYYIGNITLINAGSNYKYCYLLIIGYAGVKQQYLIKPALSMIMEREYSGSPAKWTTWSQMENKTIIEGTGIIDNTYISRAERNRYSRVGQVVSYSFTLTKTGTWGNTTAFITGLPKAKIETRFLALNTITNTPIRLVITPEGKIQNAYSSSIPEEGHLIEGQITYITSD